MIYKLIRKEDRREACVMCKNLLPEGDCAVELSILNGMMICDAETVYGLCCADREVADEE